MYDRKIKDEFWATFGKYMALHLSTAGEKVNWINYKTGIKQVQFRLEADDKKAGIYIELSNVDLEVQKRLFDQFARDLDLLTNHTDLSWQLQMHLQTAEGRIISRVFKEHPAVNVYIKSYWPAIISFLKFELIGLDKFWSEQKELYSLIAGA